MGVERWKTVKRKMNIAVNCMLASHTRELTVSVQFHFILIKNCVFS